MDRQPIDETTLRDWLIKKIAATTEQPEGSISTQEAFYNFGLSSRQGVSIAGELEGMLGFSLPGTLLFDHPNIEELSAFLARAHAEGGLPREDFLE